VHFGVPGSSTKPADSPGAKTLASNCSINVVKGVVADCSPDTVVVDFQTSFI